jgi:hypothetical protein
LSNSNSVAKLESNEGEWANAICSGTPPFLRLRDPAFQLEEVRSGAEASRRWVEIACQGSPELAPELFSVLGLDESQVAQAFGHARLVSGERLPAWADCLIRAIRALPEHQAESAPNEDSSEAAARAFLEAANQLLGWNELRVQYPFLDASVLGCLARQLATRVLLACGATLELENTTRVDPVWDLSRGAWMDRLCGFTGLNFVVGTAIRQWKQNALDILSRIGQDLPLLRETLLSANTGPLVAIDGDMGDRHNDGRSVAILTFASGGRVVYKPKDSRSAQKYLDLVALLNAASPSVTLRTQRILCRGSHTWEEFVQQREAATGVEASRFFRRFGMLLRLLQLVEGRDFWIDNLRVQGDSPVFIDLECILHPRIAGAGFQVKEMDLDPNLYDESVLPTGAVTQTIDVPGFGKQDFGGLSSSGPRLLPLGMWSGYRDRRNGNIWLKSGRLYWEPDAAWPQPGGRPADSVDYLEDLESGYREMQELLRRCAPNLLGEAGPLAGIGNLPVRVLMRSTWEYLVLLRASLEPNALLDANARELALGNIISTAHKWGGKEDGRRRLAIALSELDSIRALDIPEFYNLPLSSSVTDTSNLTVSGLLVGSAYHRLQGRLAAIDSFDLEKHLQVLRFAVTAIIRSPN